MKRKPNPTRQRIAEGWAHGLSMGIIAARLGITRHAVAGQIHRMRKGGADLKRRRAGR